MRGRVVDIPCPRCHNQRTVWLGASALRYCFNCRRVCVGVESSLPAELVFNPAELRRLEAYRAAVQSGFYTDH